MTDQRKTPAADTVPGLSKSHGNSTSFGIVTSLREQAMSEGQEYRVGRCMLRLTCQGATALAPHPRKPGRGSKDV